VSVNFGGKVSTPSWGSDHNDHLLCGFGRSRRRPRLPRLAPSLVLHFAWPGPIQIVPLGSWHRCHLEPGAIQRVRITQTGSTHKASTASTIGAQRLRSVWCFRPYFEAL